MRNRSPLRGSNHLSKRALTATWHLENLAVDTESAKLTSRINRSSTINHSSIHRIIIYETSEILLPCNVPRWHNSSSHVSFTRAAARCAFTLWRLLFVLSTWKILKLSCNTITGTKSLNKETLGKRACWPNEEEDATIDVMATRRC